MLQSIACLRRFLEIGKAQRGVNNCKRLRREGERYKTCSLFSRSRLPHSYSSFRVIRDFTIHRRDGNENVKKLIGSEGKQQLRDPSAAQRACPQAIPTPGTAYLVQKTITKTCKKEILEIHNHYSLFTLLMIFVQLDV